MLQRYKLQWDNDSIGIDEQRIYITVKGEEPTLIGTVAPNIREFVFEADYGDEFLFELKVESVSRYLGQTSNKISEPVVHELIPEYRPLTVLVDPAKGNYRQLIFESDVILELENYPDFPQPNRLDFTWEAWLPNTTEILELKIWPKNRTQPLGAISWNNMLLEVRSWCTSGHAPTNFNYTGNPYIIIGGQFVRALPADLHPSITSLNSLFASNRVLTDFDLSTWDTSNVTDMAYLFSNSNYRGNISTWDTSNVTDMRGMFQYDGAFTGDLSNWDVSKVKHMDDMFREATSFNSDLPWDTSSLISMVGVFRSAYSFVGDVSGWDVSRITDMSNVFLNAFRFNRDVSSWDVSNVTNMYNMFAAAESFNQDISIWDVSNVTDMGHLFHRAISFNQDLSRWDTSKVTNMSYLFASALEYNQPVNTWDVSNVRDMSYMFNIAMKFNQSVFTWNTSKVTNMAYMFSEASVFNELVEQFDVSNVTNMERMFEKASLFNYPLNSWDVRKVTNMSYMFSDAVEFNRDLNSWRLDSLINAEGMFKNAVKFNGNISNWDVTTVANFSSMFFGASVFNQNITEWDVSRANNMALMFAETNEFNQDISGWDVSSVTTMSSMFSKARVFNQPIGVWDVSSVTEMSMMFSNALAAGYIDLTNWCVSNILFPPFAFRANLNVPQGTALPDPVWGTCPSQVDMFVPFTMILANAPNGLDISASDVPFEVKLPGRDPLPAIQNQWSPTLYEFVLNEPLVEGTVVRVSPTNRSDPLTCLSIRTPLKEIVSWCETGHATMSTTYNSDGVARILRPTITLNGMSKSTLTKVPSTLHPSIRSLNGIVSQTDYVTTDISLWDVSNVEDMAGAFYEAQLELNGRSINTWDTSNVVNMSHMFYKSSTRFALGIGTWDTSKVTNMSYMFFQAFNFNEDISTWDVSKVTNMTFMFSDAWAFNKSLNTWDTSNVTNMSYMFRNAQYFNGLISDWDVSNVTNMSNMFYQAYRFNKPLNDWDVSEVRFMEYMFYQAREFNQPLGNWNTKSVIGMRYMFFEASVFDQDLSQWCTPNYGPYDYGNFAHPQLNVLRSSYFPVWGTCPRGEDQEMYCVPDVIDITNETIETTITDVVGIKYQIDDNDVVTIAVELGIVEANPADMLLLAAAKSGNQDFLELVLGTLVFTENTLSSQPVPPLTHSSGGTIVFHRNTNNQVTKDLFALLFNTTDDEVSLTTCAFGNMKTITLPPSELNLGLHIRKSAMIDRKRTLVFNKENEFLGTLEQFLAWEDITTLIDTDTEIKVKHITDSLSGYKIISAETLESVPFFILPETPVEDDSFKPMIISGNINSPQIYSHSPLNIKYPPGTSNISQEVITEGVTEPLYIYSAQISSMSTYGGRIQISHIDGVSRIRGLSIPYGGSYIEQWYSGGYDSFSTPSMVGMGLRGLGNYTNRVPEVAPPNTINMDYMFNSSTSLNQDLSKWCVTDITTMPNNFASFNFPAANLPVWGTCPVVTEEVDSFSMTVQSESTEVTFYSKTPLSIDWGPIAKPTDELYNYEDPGLYTYIRIYDEDAYYSSSQKNREIKITAADGVSKIEGLGFSGIGAIRQWYANGYDGFRQGGFSEVKYLPMTQPPNTTNYSNMLSQTYYAIAPDIENWDMSEATNLSRMFYSSIYFNQDISNWNVGNVTNMEGMLYSAYNFTYDLSQWCVGGIRNKPSNFDAGTSIPSSRLPVWGTCPRGEVEQPEPELPTDTGGYIGDWMELNSIMGPVYLISTQELDIDWGDPSVNVQHMPQDVDMTDIFESETPEILTVHMYIGTFNTEFGSIYEAPNNIKVRPKGGVGPLESFGSMYVGKVAKWYKEGYSVNQKIINADYPLDYVMASTAGATITEVPPIAPPKTTNYFAFFANTMMFNSGIRSWDMSSATVMRNMFSNSVFNEDIGNWNVSNVTDMKEMFSGAESFNQDLSQWCVSNITELPENFDEYTQLTAEKLPVWGTCPVKLEDGEIPSNEIHFTTTTGYLDYYGVIGDQLVFSDGTTVTLDEDYLHDIVSPVGKHKVVLKESRSDSYVGLGGEALVELHNFPTLSSVNALDTHPSPNLVKVPTVLPSNITSLSWMFQEATSFNQDISMWDTSNVIEMSGMFQEATSFNQDISMWDTSNVTDMNYMFYNTLAFNQDISSWNVSNVTSMSGMFSYAMAFNQPLNSWNVRNVTDMDYMFNGANAFNQPLNNWNVSNVTNMEYMFSGASAFNQDLSDWCVSNVTELPDGFDQEATNWILPRPVWGTCPRDGNISDSDFTKVTYIKTDTSNTMWVGADYYTSENINGELHIDWGDGDKEVLNIADFEADEYYLYLEHEYAVNGEYLVKVYSTNKADYLGFGEITKVIDWGSPNTSVLYFSPENLIEVPSTLHPSLTLLDGMFWGATKFNQDLSMWDTSNVTSMYRMFSESTFNQDISMWDTSNVTNMYGMFFESTSFNQDLSNWDTSNVEEMNYMFYGATEFNQDLSQWCVTNIMQEPEGFSIGSPLTEQHKPVWGTCPSNGGGDNGSSRYAFIPWEFPVGILPKPSLEDFWDSTLNGGYGDSTYGYDEIYYRLREPENVNEWTVEINDQVIGVTQTYNETLPDDFEEVHLMSLLQKDTGLECVYLSYINVVGEEDTRKDLFLYPDFSAPWLEGVIYEILAEEIAEGRGSYDNGHVVTENLHAAILVNHTDEPLKLKLTPTRPEVTLLPQWGWGYATHYDEADRKYTYAYVHSLPPLAERVHMEKGALPTVDPITGAITIIIDPLI